MRQYGVFRVRRHRILVRAVGRNGRDGGDEGLIEEELPDVCVGSSAQGLIDVEGCIQVCHDVHMCCAPRVPAREDAEDLSDTVGGGGAEATGECFVLLS